METFARFSLVHSAWFLLILSRSTVAQPPGTGAIAGTVTDSAGRVIANAEAPAADEATHATRTVRTKIFHETSGMNGGIGYEVWLLSNDQHKPRQAYDVTDWTYQRDNGNSRVIQFAVRYAF